MEPKYATSCILTEHHDKLFSLIPFMYPTILNVVKHGKRVKQMKTTYLVKVKWGRKQRTTIPETPHEHIIDLYCSALNIILELLNMQSKATMLN